MIVPNFRTTIFAAFKSSHERFRIHIIFFHPMMILLSPAKKMHLDPEIPAFVENTEPAFLAEAEYLVKKLKGKSPRSLRNMMNISENLAQLNAERFSRWEPVFEGPKALPAAYVFAGDVYVGLNTPSFSEGDVAFAALHTRILSGLYGALRPTDGIMPYRLEMGTSWKITPAKKNLYAYWQKKVTEHIREAVDQTASDFVLDLSSREYGDVVNRKAIDLPFVAPVFMEEKGGDYKTISYFAKKARGLMANFVVTHRPETKEDLRAFQAEGYTWNDRLSDLSKNKWVYTRKST